MHERAGIDSYQQAWMAADFGRASPGWMLHSTDDAAWCNGGGKGVGERAENVDIRRGKKDVLTSYMQGLRAEMRESVL